MGKKLLPLVVFVGCWVVVNSAEAQDFSWVGGRYAALGGAGVALVDDATATHFNPAALAFREAPDSVIAAGGGGEDRRKLLTAIDDFSSIDRDALAAGDPVATAEANDALARMAQTDAGFDGRLAGGIFLSQGGAGLSVEELDWVAAIPVVDQVHVAPGADPNVGIANNETRIDIDGLRLQEAVRTYSYAVVPALLSIGVNLKYVRGTTYRISPLAFDLDDASRQDVLRDGLENNDVSTNRFAWDAGVLLVPTESIRIGATARYLNQPRFRRKDDADVRLDRQIRVGVALSLDGFESTALALDVDLAPTEDPLAERDARRAALGAEVRLGSIFLRGGARTDLEAEDDVIVPTAGLGLGAGRLRFDLAAAWLADRDAEVAASLRWTLPN